MYACRFDRITPAVKYTQDEYTLSAEKKVTESDKRRFITVSSLIAYIYSAQLGDTSAS